MDILAHELAGVVRERLSPDNRLFLAESCTGGLISAMLTRVPGVSEFYLGGVVAYSNELKTRLLGVPPDLLREHGAVSRPVAVAMLASVDSLYGATLACAVTGVAGPAGGSPEKPVGCVYIACRLQENTWVRRFDFTGAGRREVQELTARAALLALHQACVSGAPAGFEPA